MKRETQGLCAGSAECATVLAHTLALRNREFQTALQQLWDFFGSDDSAPERVIDCRAVLFADSQVKRARVLVLCLEGVTHALQPVCPCQIRLNLYETRVTA